MEQERVSFEDAYARLEDIVGRLESDDLPIDAAVELYEAGVELIRHCSSCLDGAELRIKQLLPMPDGDLRTVPVPYPN